MVERLLDLDQRFPIVDPKTGQPTDYFMRMLLDRRVSQTAATDDIVTLDDEKAAKATEINTGFGLSGGGDLSANRTLALGNPALSDPGADRGVFWDDSAGKLDWLTYGSGLSLSGTTLTASGGGSFNGAQINLNATNTAINNATIPFTTAAFDSASWFSAANNGFLIPSGVAYVRVNLCIVLTTDPANTQIWIKKNGTQYATCGGDMTFGTVSVEDVLAVTSGDIIQGHCNVNATLTGANALTHMSIQAIG